MEDQFNFVLRLSLEEMALRRLVVNLWSEDDVLASIEDLRFQWLPKDEDGSERQIIVAKAVRKSERWLETLEMVVAKVIQCVLPQKMEHRMMHYVRPIGFEILTWRLMFQEAHLSNSREDSRMHLNQLSWTSAGSVDYAKTAERLIRLQTIDILKRYKLACLYCLEEDLKFLWKELPEEYKTGINGRLGGSPFKVTPLEDYWSQVLKGETPHVNFDGERNLYLQSSVHCRAFEYSISTGNKAAAEYFLQKLTAEERGSSLVKAACDVLLSASGCLRGLRCDFPKTKLADLFCYLFSQMTPEEKVKTMKDHPMSTYSIFGCLLNWPWQDLFLDTVDLTHSLPRNSYGIVIGSISTRVTESSACFTELLLDFFLRSPRDFRNHFVFILFETFFLGCPCIPQVETMKEIFRNVNLREGLLASHILFTKILVQFSALGKWDIVEMCLQEALLSKEDGEKLRENFEVFRSYLEESLSETGEARRFLELLDKTEASAIGKKLEQNPDQCLKKL